MVVVDEEVVAVVAADEGEEAPIITKTMREVEEEVVDEAAVEDAAVFEEAVVGETAAKEAEAVVEVAVEEDNRNRLLAKLRLYGCTSNIGILDSSNAIVNYLSLGKGPLLFGSLEYIYLYCIC